MCISRAVARRVVMVYFTRFSMPGVLTWYIVFTSMHSYRMLERW
nr:MAG TPA: hypothetical protein [Caudoviricetes sp.]